MQNKYEVIGIVGEGAYGIVYKCRNKETKEFVAIKKFKESEDELVKKTMRRELRVLQVLKNENIVEFKEAFKKKGNLFLVFEYVERNLLELLEESPSGLSPQLIKNLTYQLCKAVKYLHDQDIIHRDVKPENLLIDNKMNLKLCDFGFARKIAANKKENLTDYVATRWYRSPELLITGGIYGPEVDYWAIGCIMGELADGNPLFPGENETDQLHCIQKVLGNLPEDQVETFYNNPLFTGKSLIDVEKPETLERRYMGKLPKLAISFMKGLLELDPKKRLCGEKVFSHPYFACFAENETKHQSQSQRENKPKIAITNPKILNTTNINIINYNTYTNTPTIVNSTSTKENNTKETKENKSLPKKMEKEPNNNIMAMTMTNRFPQMYKKNILKTNGKMNLQRQSYDYQKEKELTTSINFTHKNKDTIGLPKNYNDSLVGYKTYYKNKNDKYNFSINTNFGSNYNSNYYKGNSIIEEEDEYKTNSKKYKNLNTINLYTNNYNKLKTNSNLYDHINANNKEKNKTNIYHNYQQTYFEKKSNISTSPSNRNQSKGNGASKSNNIYLPSLGKNYNYNNGNNNYGYYKNLKQFQQMITK